MKIKLGVFFGGRSVEHEVSIITAIQAINKIDEVKYEVVPIYIAKDGRWYTGKMLLDIDIYSDIDLLKRYAKEVVLYNRDGRFLLQNKKGIFKSVVAEIDMAFPIMHGTNGEDGTLQGYLETIGIPYAESNVYASAVGQDKVFMKQIFKENSVNVVKYKWFFDTDYMNDALKVIHDIEKLGYPVVVKPAMLGSSVGISVCHNELELRDGILEAIKYDSKILVEEVVKNLREVNISVLGNYEHQELSSIEEVKTSHEILTYEDKYIGNAKSGKLKGEGMLKGMAKGASKGMARAGRIIPASLDDDLVSDIKSQAIKAFRALNSNGVVRIDFLIDEKERKVYVNEINSIPGSLSFYLWEPAGKKYSELLDDILNLGIVEYKNKKAKTSTFSTNILEGFNGVKGLKGLKGIKGVKGNKK